MYVLLMNPSNTFPPKSIDSTIQNVIRVAYALKEFKKVVILNSFSKICGNGEEAKKYFKNKNVKLEEKNEKLVINFLESVDEILIACGDGVSEEQYQSYLTQLKDKKIWTYANSLTLNSRPRHLSIQHSENRNQFYEFIKNPQKNYLIIKEDDGHFFVESK